MHSIVVAAVICLLAGSAAAQMQMQGGTVGAPTAAIVVRGDPSECISSGKTVGSDGFIGWFVKNKCDDPITFKYDQCVKGDDGEPSCRVRSGIVKGKSRVSGRNYGRPAKVRGYGWK